MVATSRSEPRIDETALPGAVLAGSGRLRRRAAVVPPAAAARAAPRGQGPGARDRRTGRGPVPGTALPARDPLDRAHVERRPPETGTDARDLPHPQLPPPVRGGPRDAARTQPDPRERDVRRRADRVLPLRAVRLRRRRREGTGRAQRGARRLPPQLQDPPAGSAPRLLLARMEEAAPRGNRLLPSARRDSWRPRSATRSCSGARSRECRAT